MCGIFGYVGTVPKRRRQEFREFLTRLAVFTSERGMHATGYAAYYKGTRKRLPAFAMVKKPLPAADFVRGKAWRGVLRNLPSVFVGHCRYSTGSTASVNRNNHPFVGERFALVHNGRVENARQIERDYDLSMESDTDSEILLRLTELCGDLVRGSIECLRASTGGVAVAVLEKGSGNLALYRESKKPMHAVYVRRWGVLVYASTDTILGRALVDSPSLNVDRSARWVHYGSENRRARGRFGSIIPRGPLFSVPTSTPSFALEALDGIVSLRPDRVYRFNPYLGSEGEHAVALNNPAPADPRLRVS